MSRAIFPLRMSAQLREAVRDRANADTTTQTDLIRTAIKQYLICSKKQPKSTLVVCVKSNTDRVKSTAPVEVTDLSEIIRTSRNKKIVG